MEWINLIGIVWIQKEEEDIGSQLFGPSKNPNVGTQLFWLTCFTAKHCETFSPDGALYRGPRPRQLCCHNFGPGKPKISRCTQKYCLFCASTQTPLSTTNTIPGKVCQNCLDPFFSLIHFWAPLKQPHGLFRGFTSQLGAACALFSEHLNHIHMVCHPCAKAMLVSSLHLHNFSVFWPHVFRMELWFHLANHTPQQLNAV